MRPRLNLRLTEEQQLILTVLLVVLVMVSMLYCLGFASLAVHQVWENAPLPWNETEPVENTIDATPTSPPVESMLPATTALSRLSHTPILMERV